MVTVQELKGASIEELESKVQDARKNNEGTLKYEYHLINKYCTTGVSVSVMLSSVICEVHLITYLLRMALNVS